MVNEYPTMHHFGNPGHTQAMINLYYFYRVSLGIPVKIALWECYLRAQSSAA